MIGQTEGVAFVGFQQARLPLLDMHLHVLLSGLGLMTRVRPAV
jgi:hypothetical protein